LNKALVRSNSMARSAAPVRFLRGRWENLLTLQQKASYLKIKINKVFYRYLKIFKTLIYSIFPFLEHQRSTYFQRHLILRVLTFAKKTIPFYQNTLRDFDVEAVTLEKDNSIMLANLPILTKDLIRSHFPDGMLNPNRSFQSHLLARTSGTTSQSIQHIRPNNADTRTLINSVISYEKGFLTRPVFVLSTPHCSGLNCSLTNRDREEIPFVTRSFFLRHLADLVPLKADRNISEQDPEMFHTMLQTLLSYQPSILVGDPVYLCAFSWFLIENKCAIPKVKFILTSYELLTPSQKALLEGVFKCPVHAQYGGSEILGVARTCAHGFFHENERDVLVEVVKNGQRALPGEIGEVLLTDLRNFNMPFIRYQIGDAVERISGKCPCGQPQKRLGLIHGRCSDLFFSSHQKPREISPLLADHIFKGVKGIKFYRLIKKGASKYEISYIPSIYFKAAHLDLIWERAKFWLGDNAELTFKMREFFRPEVSMKFRFSFEEVSAKA